MSAQWVIGVDFGTAFSKAAVTQADGRDGRMIFPLKIGAAAEHRRPFIVPSAIFLDRRNLHFGPQAHRALAREVDDKRELLQSFKTILAANDFHTAVDLYPRRAIDPDGVFTLRELIVLYLAYLLELVDRAAPEQVGRVFKSADAARFRFSRPGWNPNKENEANAAMASMFRRAAAAHAALGPRLVEGGGLPYQQAQAVLADSNMWREDDPNFAGGVYEAGAVAACHLQSTSVPDHLLVVDVGAGTTDFAGFARGVSGALDVVPSSRVTIDIAGDTIDRALMNLVLNKAKELKTRDEQMLLWRNLGSVVRDFKEQLVERGHAEVTFGKLKINCKSSELYRDNGYKAALGDIREVFEFSLGELVKIARRARGRRVGVVLSGGGAHLKPIIDVVSRARHLDGVSIELVPATPQWALELGADEEFRRSFSQLCVAFGTAIIGASDAETEVLSNTRTAASSL